MANDINTETPGSAVADQLQNILARKRNDARQAMMDDITRRATDARINYENENAASLAEQRAAMAEFRNSEAGKNWLAGLGPSPTDIDQATYERGRQLAPGSFQMDQSQGPTEDGSPLPPSYRYLGSPQYREEQQTIGGIGDLMNDPNFSNLSPEQKLLRIMQVPGALHSNSVAPIMERLLSSKAEAPMVPAMGLNKVNGRLSPLIGPDNKPILVPQGSSNQFKEWGEKPNAEPSMVPYVDNTNGVVRYWGFNPKTNTYVPSSTAPNAPAAPGPNLRKPGEREPAAPGLYGEKQAAALRASLLHQGNSKTTRQAREAAEADFIQSITDPGIRAEIQRVRSDKNARLTPVDKLMSIYTPPPDITDEAAKAQHIAAIRSILSQLPLSPRLVDEQ